MNLELKSLYFSCTKDCTTVYSLQYTITVIHMLSLKLLLYKHTHMKEMTRCLDSLIVLFHPLYINITFGFQNCDNPVYTFLNEKRWCEIFCNKIKMLMIFSSILISLIFLVETDFAPSYLFTLI